MGVPVTGVDTAALRERMRRASELDYNYPDDYAPVTFAELALLLDAAEAYERIRTLADEPDGWIRPEVIGQPVTFPNYDFVTVERLRAVLAPPRDNGQHDDEDEGREALRAMQYRTDTWQNADASDPLAYTTHDDYDDEPPEQATS